MEHVGVSPLRDSQGRIQTDDKKKATIFNDQFASVFSKEDDITPYLSSPICTSMPDIIVNSEGVKKLLLKLKPNKSTGPDLISARFLKEVATEIAPAITLLFNASLNQGAIPTEWKEAYISPIYKVGKKDRGIPENYRPISLTSVTSKVLEHIVYSNVMTHLAQLNILTDVQHGFRKRRGCETQLTLVINDLAKALNNTEQVDTILLDFSKAFDKVNHRKLYIKLRDYGIRGTLLDWFKDFLTGRTQQVVINGEMSSKAVIKSGVPQGTVLGPLLFLIYINDLPEKITSSLKLFADDSYMYRVINNAQDNLELQNDLDILSEWEKEWSLEFHPDKCKVLRVTNKLNQIRRDYHIHGHTLDTVDCAKYLGVTINKKLSWQPHVDAICKKANKTRAFLQRNLKNCYPEIKEQCYKTYVRPQLEYASVVWDPVGDGNSHLRHQLEMVQRRAAQFVYDDWRRESSPTRMINHLNWQSLETRRLLSKLTFFHKHHHKQIDLKTASP